MKRRIAIALLFAGLLASGFSVDHSFVGASLAPTAHADDGSATVMIGGDGIVLGPSKSICQLFNANGRAIPGGTMTMEIGIGLVKFTWQVNGATLMKKANLSLSSNCR